MGWSSNCGEILERYSWSRFPRKENTRVGEFSELDPFDPKATIGILVGHIVQPNTRREVEVMMKDPLDSRSLIIDYMKSPLVAIDF